MPNRQPNTVVYAAGASLAAIALIYVFAPSWIFGGEKGINPSGTSSGVVGMINGANDCYINSVLQALAGLPDLRIFLIRETHRRRLDGSEIYSRLDEHPARENVPRWKVKGLRSGVVTEGLKSIIDALNERPLSGKKTISAGGFIAILEHAFRQRISRQQQDAQEFLQVLAERLCDEYYAGRRARQNISQDRIKNDVILDEWQERDGALLQQPTNTEDTISRQYATSSLSLNRLGGRTMLSCTEKSVDEHSTVDEEEGFPLMGETESTIECLTCGWKKSVSSIFCALTLNVPQRSTSLNSCFDSMFKTEYIDDFKCDRCRLIHAKILFQHEATKETSSQSKSKKQEAIALLQSAIDSDPERPPEGVELPDIKHAPLRRIAKHARITRFPKIIAIHLSRSIFDAGSSTLKNGARVIIPEQLSLGGLLSQHGYRLSSVICHKGSHYSGHYDLFRRQSSTPPYSTPNVFGKASVYGNRTTTQSLPSNNDIDLDDPGHGGLLPVSVDSSTPSPYTNGQAPVDSKANEDISDPRPPASRITSATSQNEDTGGSLRAKDGFYKNSSQRSLNNVFQGWKKKRKRSCDKWWRISDDRIQASSLKEALSFQKEAYILFYELEKGENSC